MWGCFLMSGVKILHFLKDWWKSIPIHQNYTMALMQYFQLFNYISIIFFIIIIISSINWLIIWHRQRKTKWRNSTRDRKGIIISGIKLDLNVYMHCSCTHPVENAISFHNTHTLYLNWKSKVHISRSMCTQSQSRTNSTKGVGITIINVHTQSQQLPHWGIIHILMSENQYFGNSIHIHELCRTTCIVHILCFLICLLKPFSKEYYMY